MRLVLASASPRRAELLTNAGIDFEVAPAWIDETPKHNEAPVAYVLRIASEKAAWVAEHEADAQPILAADTVVVAAGRLLGKPSSRDDAREMLKLLAGAIHDVHTGVVLRVDRQEIAEAVTTRVRFVPLTDAEISWYVDTGEPDGKAGAYAIQGRASRFIDWIEGSWSNVVGLPVATVSRMLKQAGVV